MSHFVSALYGLRARLFLEDDRETLKDKEPFKLRALMEKVDEVRILFHFFDYLGNEGHKRCFSNGTYSKNEMA